VVDPVAEVIERPDLVWTADVPRPVLVSSEHRALFAFMHNDGQARVAEFIGCVTVRFGFPNDEALHGHPLWGSGLAFYELHNVTNSPWLAELRQTESAHPSAPPDPFPNARHLVLTFHDSMLEAVADDVVVLGRHESLSAAIAEMADAVGADSHLRLTADSSVHFENVMPLIEELSRLLHYSFDDGDEVAVEYGLSNSSAETGAWFGYPLVGDIRLDVGLARYEEADPVMVRLRSEMSVPSDLRARIETTLSLFNSFRFKSPRASD
jgi:hypothetical protein